MRSLPNSTAIATILLFLSGMAGLILQVCWFREFRFVFGLTTAASAAVLAAFMAGLGLGNALLGPRADHSRHPLRLYGFLEAGIALSAVLTPWLIDVARGWFHATGGEAALGASTATVWRLALSFAVLLVPTFLMGGTLPAAASAFTRPTDQGRSTTAWLYGANTFGAVAGAFLATFFLLEQFGVRRTLWTGCALAATASLLAFLLARRGAGRREVVADSLASPVGAAGSAARSPLYPEPAARSPRRPGPTGREDLLSPPSSGNFYYDTTPLAPVWLLAVAAALSGFVFFAMELVWFRMLGPILGGTTYTFGLIVAVALAGIGLGAALYAVIFARRRPTLTALAFTALAGALCLAATFAIGDRLPVLVTMLDGKFVQTFLAGVTVWTLVAALVVLPFAVVAGVQFPLIVALCGAGPQRVGRQVGLVYAGNTLGSILGALAGGFGLLPLLTAPGAWRFMAMIALLAGVALLVYRHRRTPLAQRPIIFAGVFVVLTLWFLAAEGPTAAWRHGGVGAGRPEGLASFDANSIREWRNRERASLVWEADGVEASVGITDNDSFAFYVNGKCDGNAVSDAGTQIMLGLLGAAFHPDPRSAFIVGLGTGETAGWLAQVPSMERIDVAEIEPATLEMARLCAPVNYEVLQNPKVHVLRGDARELLLSGRNLYDLIACEPSNPYRNGVADLFTAEFYRAARARLAPDGIFLQWLQGYEVDARTVRTVLTTLQSVFPHVEIWQTMPDDFVILCSETPPRITAEEFRRRLAAPPFVSALPAAWFTSGAEGFLAHFVGGPALVRSLIDEGAPVPVNTDDRNAIEYGFARTLGRPGLFDTASLLQRAATLGDNRPLALAGEAGSIDWTAVERARTWDHTMGESIGDPPAVITAWESGGTDGAHLAELAAVARAYATQGDAKAEPLMARVRSSSPATAEVIAAVLAASRQDPAAAVAWLDSVFQSLRRSPWLPVAYLDQALVAAVDLARSHPEHAPRLLAALAQPFAAEASKSGRLKAACFIAAGGPPQAAIPFLEAHEPHVPWAREFLVWRRDVYTATGHPLAPQAAAELEEFERNDAWASSQSPR